MDINNRENFNELKELILHARSCLTCNYRYKVKDVHVCTKHNFDIHSINDIRSDCEDYNDEI